MWCSPAVRMVCIIFGIIYDVKLVGSITRQSNGVPAKDSKLEDIRKVIQQIHSLSAQNSRSFVPSTEEPVNLNMYYSILSNLNNLFLPLQKEGFFEDLPKILVCLLSERQDCGLPAELTKTVSLEMGEILMFFTSLRSQTCTPPTSDGEASTFFGQYLNIGNMVMAAFDGFQQMLINMVSNLTLSESMTNVLRGLLDSVAANVLRFIVMLLEMPLDYVRIALELGIQIPSLNEQEPCKQGDLKQLLMWGLKHNVSWSLGVPLIDILLEIFLPSDSGPGCRSPSSILLQRSASQLSNYSFINYKISCDHRNLAALNDTLCADILMGFGEGSSMSLLTFCQALSSLSSSQMEHVWSNMCNIFQSLMSPLVTQLPDCVVGDAQPSVVYRPLNESHLVSPSLSGRFAREAPSLRQLACDYSSWANGTADAALVSSCSDNEHMEFVRQVCNNTSLMRKLLSDQSNIWLYAFCSNSSADAANMVSQFCAYEQWVDRPARLVNSALLQFCISLDAPRLTSLICEHTGFLMLLISNPDNWPLMPNCSNSPPPLPFPGPDLLEPDSCQYFEWHDVMQITTDMLSKCIIIDQSRFTSEVCANKTFLNSLLQNKNNAWLEAHCSSALVPPLPVPTQALDLMAWCNYHTWEEKQLDESVIALCWQIDQVAFQENVCCKAAVFEKLLENPQNKWLLSVCTDMEQITVTPQVCRYSDWTRPIIVDMTDLALCAAIDPHNFTSKVCANKTVLQNLLANQDNGWLIKHCANYSGSVTPPVGGGGQTTPTEFKVAEQCLYSSWITSLPNATLLAQCWENDQINFVSSVCPNAGLLFLLSREPSTIWVSNMCATYTNYTNNNNNTTTDPRVCASETLLSQFSLMCPHYFIPDCQPCPSQNMVLQMMVRCWVESLNSRMEGLLATPVSEVLNRVVATTVVILLAVEDSMGPIWDINNIIRKSVLTSVVEYLKREINQDRKTVLLQCFGTVISSLLQTSRDMTSNELILIKEYFSLPLSSLRPVLAVAHISTVRLILQYYNRFKNTLQLSEEYRSIMVSVLLNTHQASDDKLLLQLGSLLAAASPADIHKLPPLQNNVNVRETINTNLDRMSLAQREAFGLWYGKTMSPSNITGGHQSLIRDTGNVIAYFPFQTFQHLSAAQLLDGLDVLQRNILSPLKQELVANKLIGMYRNLTAQDFIRLGNLSCLADAQDLLVYRNTEAFQVIQESIINCTLRGLSLQSQLLSDVLLNNPEFRIPSSLSASRVKELAPLLPSLGLTFLNSLTASQLLSALPALSSVPFTPIQASVMVDKLFLNNTLNPGQLEVLGSLIVGVKTETLQNLSPGGLFSALKAFAQHTPVCCQPGMHCLYAPEANAIATKLWGFPEVISWLDDMEPLLSCTPLLSILPKTMVLVKELSITSSKPWKTQQAQAIVRQLIDTNPNLIKQDILGLGTLGQGLSCSILAGRFQADPSPSPVRKILSFLRDPPGLLHTSLKKCVIEELSQFDFFADLLQDLGAEIALAMPLSTIKKFSTEMMEILRKMIVASPEHFLMLSRRKQELLVDKIVQRMNMYTETFTEEEFRSLDIMAPFVLDEVFDKVDRTFFTQNLGYLQRLCYSSNKMEIVSRILQEPAVFGPVKNWNQATLSVVGRFLFFLPTQVLQEISLPLMTVGRIEKLFTSQRQWAYGDVGSLCSDMNEREAVFGKQQFVLQFFLGFLKMNSLPLTPMVPSCQILHTTSPSAWTSSSLSSMSSSVFSNCLELMGRDPFLASYQRSEVLKRVKKSVIAQLGVIATELSPEELSSLRLTERRSIGAMGAVSTWKSRQRAALFSSVLNSTRLTPSRLDSSMLVALGHIVCGAQVAEIKNFNNVEFGKAVLWLGQLRLSCSEEQMLALVELLTHRLAFGLMSSWGTDVFIEIGILAAGLSDMAMSALVKEQIEGIIPMAISFIPPEKFAVVFHQSQISMFSYEQAVAVTPQQLAVMTDVQRTALARVLTPWEDKPPGGKTWSQGLALSHSPFCLILGMLMLLTTRF